MKKKEQKIFNSSIRRLVIVTLFGVLIFLSKGFLPTPIKDAFIVFQALFLALGSLIIGKTTVTSNSFSFINRSKMTLFGATYIGLVSGILLVLVRPSLAIFTLGLSVLYGLLIDLTFMIFNVRLIEHMTIKNNKTDFVKVNRRIIFSVTLSTIIVGGIGYSLSVFFRLVPPNLVLEVFVLLGGLISGLIGGYLSAVIWRRIYPSLIKY